MPKDEIDPEDPHALVGVVVPVANQAEADEALARGLVEEFVRLGFDTDAVLDIFKTQFYAGANRIYASRGEEYIRELLLSANRRYRPMSSRVMKDPADLRADPSRDLFVKPSSS